MNNLPAVKSKKAVNRTYFIGSKLFFITDHPAGNVRSRLTWYYHVKSATDISKRMQEVLKNIDPME